MLNDGTIDIGYAQEENAPITEDQFREFWERLGALAEKKGDGDDNSDESDS